MRSGKLSELCGLGLGAVMLASPAVAQDHVQLQLGEQREFTFDNGETYLIDAGGMRIELGVDDPDPNQDYDEVIVARVHRKGAEDFTQTFTAGFSLFADVGYWPLDRDGQPSLVLQAYTGGAHCCMDVFAVRPQGNGWAATPIGYVDGGEVVPQDLDGDGLVEFRLADERFNYAFDAYAFSVPPPTIIATRNGEFADLSEDPRFRPVYEDFYDYAALLCTGAENDDPDARSYSSKYAPNSACASLMAVGARLGIYDGTKALVRAARLSRPQQDQDWTDYLIITDDSEESFADLIDAADYALKAWGYLD